MSKKCFFSILLLGILGSLAVQDLLNIAQFSSHENSNIIAERGSGRDRETQSNS